MHMIQAEVTGTDPLQVTDGTADAGQQPETQERSLSFTDGLPFIEVLATDVDPGTDWAWFEDENVPIGERLQADIFVGDPQDLPTGSWRHYPANKPGQLSGANNFSSGNSPVSAKPDSAPDLPSRELYECDVGMSNIPAGKKTTRLFGWMPIGKNWNGSSGYVETSLAEHGARLLLEAALRSQTGGEASLPGGLVGRWINVGEKPIFAVTAPLVLLHGGYTITRQVRSEYRPTEFHDEEVLVPYRAYPAEITAPFFGALQEKLHRVAGTTEPPCSVALETGVAMSIHCSSDSLPTMQYLYDEKYLVQLLSSLRFDIRHGLVESFSDNPQTRTVGFLWDMLGAPLGGKRPAFISTNGEDQLPVRFHFNGKVGILNQRVAENQQSPPDSLKELAEGLPITTDDDGFDLNWITGTHLEGYPRRMVDDIQPLGFHQGGIMIDMAGMGFQPEKAKNIIQQEEQYSLALDLFLGVAAAPTPDFSKLPQAMESARMLLQYRQEIPILFVGIIADAIARGMLPVNLIEEEAEPGNEASKVFQKVLSPIILSQVGTYLKNMALNFRHWEESSAVTVTAAELEQTLLTVPMTTIIESMPGVLMTLPDQECAEAASAIHFSLLSEYRQKYDPKHQPSGPLDEVLDFEDPHESPYFRSSFLSPLTGVYNDLQLAALKKYYVPLVLSHVKAFTAMGPDRLEQAIAARPRPVALNETLVSLVKQLIGNQPEKGITPERFDALIERVAQTNV